MDGITRLLASSVLLSHPHRAYWVNPFRFPCALAPLDRQVVPSKSLPLTRPHGASPYPQSPGQWSELERLVRKNPDRLRREMGFGRSLLGELCRIFDGWPLGSLEEDLARNLAVYTDQFGTPYVP